MPVKATHLIAAASVCLTLSAGVSAPAVRAATSPDACPAPRVDTFDTVVQGRDAPSDTSDPGLYSWLDLASSGGGMNGALWADDPKRDQIEYVDAGIAAQHSVHQTDSPNWHRPPAQPPVDGVDYIAYPQITATSDGSGGYTYAPQVAVRDAFDYSTVANRPGPAYTDSSESWDRLHRLGDSLVPLIDTIRDYQRKLRDAGHEVAIRANRPDVNPRDTRLKEGRSTPVKVKVTDCDGAPLKGWKVKLTATHGAVSPATVTTDGGGTARAKFTARSKGLARLRAFVGPYKQVTHKTFGRFFGEGFVQIDQAEHLYRVRFTGQERVHGESDDSQPDHPGQHSLDAYGEVDVVTAIESLDPKADAEAERPWIEVVSASDWLSSGSLSYDQRDWPGGECGGEGERRSFSGTAHEPGTGIVHPPSPPFGGGTGSQLDQEWAAGGCDNINESSTTTESNGPTHTCPQERWSWSGNRLRGYTVRLNEQCRPGDYTSGTVSLRGTITITPIGVPAHGH